MATKKLLVSDRKWLAPEVIAYPVRSILRKLPNVHYCLVDVQRIEFSSRTIATNGPAILKTLEQGITLRNQILCCFERALLEQDRDRRTCLLTFTIVGGGPTGVEFAGALAELIRGPLAKDYRQLDFREVRVVLLEAMQTLLSGLAGKLCACAQDRLHGMGVELHSGAIVSEVTGHYVKLIGFRNRLLVLINWAWDYLFYERAVRLILPLRTVHDLKQTEHNAVRIQDNG